MFVRNAALAVLSALAPVAPALAQGTVAEISYQTPKPGMTAQYEAGRKKHNAWHKSQKDTWGWLTWEVLSGPHSGTYVTGSFGHAWKDFDARATMDRADDADYAKTVTPFLATVTTSYFSLRPDLSLTHPSPTDSPSNFVSINLYLLKADSVNDFVEGVKKVNEGIKKTNFATNGPSRFYQLVNGGEGPLFVLVGDRANWAAFQPNDKTLDAMMEEAYGKEQGAAILGTIRKTFRTFNSQALKFRPDLSYIPPK